MKKKILMFVLAFSIILPCAVFFSACGEGNNPKVIALDIVETEGNINHDNSWYIGSIQYGEEFNLNDFKLFLRYDDNTSKEAQVNDPNFSVKYYYTVLGSEQTEIADLTSLEIGSYAIVYSYLDNANKFEASVYFDVEKADYVNSYSLRLSQDNIMYGDALPEISVTPSTGEVVEYGVRYLNQAQYDEYLSLSKDEQQEFLSNTDQQVHDKFYGDGVIGEYYIYAEITSDNYNNKFSEPVNLTLIPATIKKGESVGEEIVTAILDYKRTNEGVTIGKVRLGDIRIDYSYEDVRYVDKYGDPVAGSLQWSNEVKDNEVDFSNNGDRFRVMFVPDSENYVPIEYGYVELQVVKGEIFYQEILENPTYNPDLTNRTFTIYHNTNLSFRPSEFIDVYKFDGSSWQKITADESEYYSLLDTVDMQAGEYKYQLRLKDATNFVWKIDGETLSSDNIEVVKKINKLAISPSFELNTASFNADGYALIPFNNDDERLTNFKVEAVNKESSSLFGDYFKGSAEFVEIEGQKYIKYTPSGLYSSDGTENNDSDKPFARAHLKISADPIDDDNYSFETLETGFDIGRLRPGPTIEETIELTTGKTYRECFTFMLPEEKGTYDSTKINLDDVVPNVLSQTQLTLSFTSNSPIYYSTNALTFNVALADVQVLDVEGKYNEVNITEDSAQENPPAYLKYLSAWMEIGMETTAQNYSADIRIDYKDSENNLKLVGSVNNQYTDTATYNNFTTDTTLKRGNDIFTISGDVDMSGTEKNYSITKNGASADYVIDKELDQMIIPALGIDLPNNSMQNEQMAYYVAEDDQNIKIKIESTSTDGDSVVVHYVFDVDGNFVGHKVSYTSADGVTSYSIQIKLISE